MRWAGNIIVFLSFFLFKWVYGVYGGEVEVEVEM